jgi:hypothetical protein
VLFLTLVVRTLGEGARYPVDERVGLLKRRRPCRGCCEGGTKEEEQKEGIERLADHAGGLLRLLRACGGG